MAIAAWKRFEKSPGYQEKKRFLKRLIGEELRLRNDIKGVSIKQDARRPFCAYNRVMHFRQNSSSRIFATVAITSLLCACASGSPPAEQTSCPQGEVVVCRGGTASKAGRIADREPRICACEPGEGNTSQIADSSYSMNDMACSPARRCNDPD